MHNFLEDPVPDDPIQRVHAFARDLAYGALVSKWESVLYFRIGENEDFPGKDSISSYLGEKWKNEKPPRMSTLVSFGYATVIPPRPPELGQHRSPLDVGGAKYSLTEKAFALLKQPAPASIFISYSRRESSAFALLILARFKAIDLEPFLDIRDISPGDDWHAELEQEVQQRENFICLIGPHTLESPYVRKEIEWALDAGVRTIPIWHNGFRYDESINPDPELQNFLKRHAIVVEKEDAKAYQSAIDELLNYFGVTPT